MELNSHVDNIVRDVIPTILEAAGKNSHAILLRNHCPISCSKTTLSAALLLREIRFSQQEGEIVDCITNCELAIYASIRGDLQAFTKYIDRATSSLRRETRLFIN